MVYCRFHCSGCNCLGFYRLKTYGAVALPTGQLPFQHVRDSFVGAQSILRQTIMIDDIVDVFVAAPAQVDEYGFARFFLRQLDRVGHRVGAF